MFDLSPRNDWHIDEGASGDNAVEGGGRLRRFSSHQKTAIAFVTRREQTLDKILTLFPGLDTDSALGSKSRAKPISPPENTLRSQRRSLTPVDIPRYDGWQNNYLSQDLLTGEGLQDAEAESLRSVRGATIASFRRQSPRLGE